MGIAVMSGLLTSLEQRQAAFPNGRNTPREPVSGISTPTRSMALEASDDSLPDAFIATVGREETSRKLRKTFQTSTSLNDMIDIRSGKGANVSAAEESDIILICSKPNVAKSILAEKGMQEAIKGKIVVSICAGITIEQLDACVPEDTTVVRAMPNTPCKVSYHMPKATDARSARA